MDRNSIVEQIVEYLLKTGFKRFLSSLVFLGVTLLGLSWVDVVAIIANKVPGEHSGDAVTAIAQWVGIALIAIGIGGRLLVHGLSIRAKRRLLAAKLLGRLRVVADGFRQKGVARDAGYYNNEIAECQNAAKQYLEVAPRQFAAHRVIAAVAYPKFDASKKAPYIDVSVNDLDDLVKNMGAHYGID